MITFLYSLYDIETETFGNVFQCPDEIILKRQLSSLVKSSQNPYKGFEDKFVCYRLGVFDNVKDKDKDMFNPLILSAKLEKICCLSDFLNKEVE